MSNKNYLTMQEIEILLKCYYLKKCSLVALDENTNVYTIKKIKDHALAVIRLSYSKRYCSGLPFDGNEVLKSMAKRSDITFKEITKIFNDYIYAGLLSENSKYWKRIKGKGDVPTAGELLNFIYDKYEIDIEGSI